MEIGTNKQIGKFLVPLAEAEENYSKAVVQYLRTVYESNLMRYLFVRNKVWKMKHQNPIEYKQTCELLGVNSLFDKYQ